MRIRCENQNRPRGGSCKERVLYYRLVALEVVEGRSLAPLGYARNEHLLNVFVWPTREADISARTGSRQGCLRRGPGRGGVAPSASFSHSGNEVLGKPVIVSPRMVPYSSTFLQVTAKTKTRAFSLPSVQPGAAAFPTGIERSGQQSSEMRPQPRGPMARRETRCLASLKFGNDRRCLGQRFWYGLSYFYWL